MSADPTMRCVGEHGGKATQLFVGAAFFWPSLRLPTADRRTERV